jgi:hypothetical protein
LHGFVKIIKTLEQNQHVQIAVLMPSMLLIQDSRMLVVTTSGEGKLEFIKDPRDGYLVTKFGNLTHPTDNLLCSFKAK